MKKGLVVILAVAIIGILGIYGRDHNNAMAGGTEPAGQTPAAAPDNSGSQAGSNTGGTTTLKDGTFTGSNQMTPYGDVQIAVVVSGGRITDVNFLQMPNDLGHTQQVTAMSEPLLKQETLQSQSSHIDFVSGATSTTEGYIQSLQDALNQASVG